MSILLKKVTSAISAAAIAFAAVAPSITSAASGFLPYAEALAAANVITTQSNEAGYRLADNAVRQEVAAIMMALNKATYEDNYACKGDFSDVSATKPNSWVCKVVETALSKGLIAANATFRPEDNTTRAEALAMILKGQGIEITTGEDAKYNDTPVTWQKDVANTALNAKIISANASFRPNDLVTRGELFVMAANAAGLQIEDDLDLDDLFGDDEDGTGTVTPPASTGSVTTPVKSGDLMISLNPTSPVSQTVPSKGVVPFGKIDLTAGSSDVSVNSITVKREGLSNRSDIRRVYFELNNVRVSSRQGLSTDDTSVVSLSPALVVKAGSTVTLDLVAELATAGAVVWAEHAFAITSVESSAANVEGAFPVKTALMRIGSYEVEAVAFDDVAGVNGTSYNVWDKNILLWEFKLDNAASEKSVKFKSITLRNAGTADVAANLSNLAIYNNAVKVSTETIVSGRDVTFTVNSDIADGRNENFQIRADVNSAERADETYNFEVRNNTDVLVTEIVTGFSSPITGLNTTVALGEVTIKWGDLLLSRDTAVSTTQTVAPNSNDVVLMAAKLNINESVLLEDLNVSFTSTWNALWLTAFNNIRLVIGGSTVATFTPSDASESSFVFEFSSNVNANTTIQVLWNLKSTWLAWVYTMASINNASFGDVRYITNDEEAELVGSVAWVVTTIGASSLLVTRNDSRVDNDKVVAWATNVELYGFNLRANDVSDVKLTSIKFVDETVAGPAKIDPAYITNVRLYRGSELIATKNNFDFNTLDVTIAKNQSVSFRVVADFATSVAANQEVKLNIDSATARALVNNVAITLDTTGSAWAKLVFTAGGSTIVTLNGSSAVSSIITPLQSKEVFKFNVEAEDDTLKVSDVYLKSTETLNSAVKSATMLVDGKTITWEFVSTGVLYFSIGDVDAVRVPADEIKTFQVNLEFHDFNTVDRSGLEVKLALAQDADYDSERAGTSNGLRVISEATGDFISNVTTSAVSKSHVLARSKVTATAASFTPSTTDIYKFTVTADANRKVTLNDLKVKIAGSADLTDGLVSVYRDNNTGNANLLGTGATADMVSGELTIDLTTGEASEEIAASQTVTYYVVLTGLSVDNTDKTREVNISELSFVDDIAGATAIATSSYNVGVPTSVSAYKY